MNEPNERKRRHFSADQKATIFRRHQGDKVPVSDLADEYQIQPSMIYLWVKQVLDQAERAFRQPDGGLAVASPAIPRTRRSQCWRRASPSRRPS